MELKSGEQEAAIGFQAEHKAADAASGVVAPLRKLARWFRLDVHEELTRSSRLTVEKSSVVIIETIWKYGPINHGRMASLLGLDETTVSRQVKRAAAAGYITEKPGATDRRIRVLALTRKGLATRHRIAEAWHRLATTLIRDWDIADQAELVRLLDKLTEQL